LREDPGAFIANEKKDASQVERLRETWLVPAFEHLMASVVPAVVIEKIMLHKNHP